MAAGQATRMGQDKLLLPWRNTTVLGYVLQAALEAINLVWPELESFVGSSAVEPMSASGPEIYVVARRPLRDYLTAAQTRRFQAAGGIWLPVPAPQPLAETIRCGLQDLRPETQYIGFLPGDQVGITAPRLADCLRQVLEHAPDFLTPVAGDKAVSPVFFHRRYVPELLELRGEQGGKAVLCRYLERWWEYPVEDGFCRDLDTPEQYQSLLEENRKGEEEYEK